MHVDILEAEVDCFHCFSSSYLQVSLWRPSNLQCVFVCLWPGSALTGGEVLKCHVWSTAWENDLPARNPCQDWCVWSSATWNCTPLITCFTEKHWWSCVLIWTLNLSMILQYLSIYLSSVGLSWKLCWVQLYSVNLLLSVSWSQCVWGQISRVPSVARPNRINSGRSSWHSPKHFTWDLKTCRSRQ